MSTLEEALVSSCWIKAAMDPTQIKHWKIEIHAGYFSISQVYNLITNGTSKNAGESLISHLLLFGKTIWKVRVYRYNVGFERKLLKQQTIETLSSCPMLHSQQPTVIIATRWAGCVASLGCLAWEEPHQLCQNNTIPILSSPSSWKCVWARGWMFPLQKPRKVGQLLTRRQFFDWKGIRLARNEPTNERNIDIQVQNWR